MVLEIKIRVTAQLDAVMPMKKVTYKMITKQMCDLDISE